MKTKFNHKEFLICILIVALAAVVLWLSYKGVADGGDTYFVYAVAALYGGGTVVGILLQRFNIRL